MKKYYILLALILIGFYVNSQDLLYFSNGNILKVNTIEQNKDGISFTLYDSSNEEVFNANSEELIRVINENGDIISFDGKLYDEYTLEYPKNRVALNVLHTPMGMITMKYEFLNKSGKVGFEIPMSVGLTEGGIFDPIGEIFDREFYSLFYTGLSINWYPLGQRQVSYLLGPTFRLGYGKEGYYYYDSYYESEPKEEYYSKLLINNGLSLNPSEHFSISFIISIGIMHRNVGPDDYKFQTTGDASINLGFRF